MPTVTEKRHSFAAAKAAGREPFKVKDLSLAEVGRQEIRLAGQEVPRPVGAAEGDARPDGAAETARRNATTRRRPRHGEPAHDHPNRRSDRDADGSRRRRAM